MLEYIGRVTERGTPGCSSQQATILDGVGISGDADIQGSVTPDPCHVRKSRKLLDPPDWILMELLLGSVIDALCNQ